MADMTKVLIVEDELTNAILLKRVLNKTGYSTVIAHSGADALKHIEREDFDAVLTDWMMPQIDGIELIRQIRKNRGNVPYIIMITALVSEGARSYALESGADDYIAKPIDVDEVLIRLRDGLKKHKQSIPKDLNKTEKKEVHILPPFIGVGIATSTGGPPTLLQIFKDIDHKANAAYFIVQHGPPWMLETFSQRLERETEFSVLLAKDGTNAEPGNVYIAPGDKHMRIQKDTYQIKLDDGPKENFVRPAADPLFRSIAESFGKYSIGMILTGLGRDGTHGVAQIAAAKGTVLVQDPDTAVAPSMPNTVIKSGIDHKLIKLDEFASTINKTVFPMNAGLKEKKKKLHNK